jgi:DNA replication protein DnaC
MRSNSPRKGRQPMLNEQTKSKLYALKLNGMATAYEEQCRQPRTAELSFDERLGLLVDRQWTWREDRALKTRLQHAKFKLSACVEDLDFQATCGLKRAQVEQLASSQWVGYHQSVIVTGPTGTGKTFLACALGQKACRDGHRVRYYVAAKLFRQLAAAHADGSFARLSGQLQKTALLIVDDWGLEKLQEAQYRDFLEILDDRQGCGATLMTSQFPLKLWHDTIGNPTVADAILDRLLHNAHRIELKGPSRR